MLLLLAVSRGLGEVFERMRQSPVVGEVLAGILLGPYVLKLAVLDAEGLQALQAVADLGVFLLVFLAGLEMDIEEIAHSVRGRGVFVGALGFLFPFLGGIGLGFLADLPLEGALFLGLALGLTALPVSVRILMDLGLTEHSIGKVVISAAIFTEVVTLTLLGVLIAFQDQAPTSFQEALYLGTITVVKTFLLFSIVITVVQVFRLTSGVVPGAQRAFRRTLGVLRGRESLFALSILFVLTFAGVSQVLGLHFVVGSFFGGLLLTGRLLGDYNYKQVYKTTSAITFGFLAPIFFGFIGLQFIPDAVVVQPLLAALVLGVGFASKLAGGYIGARVAGRPSPEGFAVGLGLTIHGVLELVVANLALQLGIFTPELFSIVVLLSVVSTVLAPPLLRWAISRIPKERDAARGKRPAAAAAAPGGPSKPDVLPAPEAPVIIVGGGRVAMELARAVGHCTIVERDEEQARAIAASLGEARVVIGSATDEESLKRAGLRAGAVVLAVTDSDAANEQVVRFARKAGARRVIARTEQTGEVERLRQLGADAVLNSAEETASAILLELYPPDATMTEIVVPKGSPAVGKHLLELKLPRGTVIRSVSRRARVIVPTPDLIIEARDNVIVSGSPAGLKSARVVLLGPRAGGESVNVLAGLPEDEEAAKLLSREASPIASFSRGAIVAAVPWESPSGTFAPKVEEIFRAAGAEASVTRGYGLTGADLQDALASARTPPPVMEEGPDGKPSVSEHDRGHAPGHELWIVALPRQAVGKGEGKISPRKLQNLASSLGSPIYVARTGHAARTVTALIDGAEGADRAGTLACDIARILNARLVLLVVRFEDEPEPLEQAAFIEAYARNAGLGTVERQEVDHPSAPAVERQLRKANDLVVAPAIPRSVRGRFLAQLASTSENSVLLV